MYKIKTLGKHYFTSAPTGLKRKYRKMISNYGQSYGEWAEPVDVKAFAISDFVSPHPEETTAYIVYMLEHMKKIADLLGKAEDAQYFKKYADRTRIGYQKLVETKKHGMDTDRQAKLVRPLYLKLLNDKQTEYAKKRLIKALDKIELKNDNTWTLSMCYYGDSYTPSADGRWSMNTQTYGITLVVENDTGELTYENSWIRAWLKNTWINELFTPAQQAILQGNENCFGDKIFLPSSSEISVNAPKPFGLYKYPFCLGAYKEVLQGYGDNYCPYWLRDGIEKGSDGKSYVTCVTSRPPFDQTTEYLATKTFIGVVPAIIINL